MSAYRYPSVFLSHGTPMLAFGEDRYQETLLALSNSMPKPKAIIFISAHSVSNEDIHILAAEKNRIQHDFTGFPVELYDIHYECPGSPAVAEQLSGLFSQAGFKVKMERAAPLDHGIWIPLLHLYPKGEVPVVRISLPTGLLPAQILKMGRTLASLREQGFLILSSGGAVNNLQAIKWSGKSSPGAQWAVQFENWVIESLQSKNVEALMNFEDHPDFLKAHPSPEHFLPILITVGSALPGDEPSVIFKGIEYESLSMLCFSLGLPDKTVYH